MGAWQSGFVLANGVRIHYTRTGGDLPVLVLAHGVTDDGLCWTPLAKELQSNFDVIMVDARGHGLSEAPAGGYEPGALAGDLAGVIIELGLKKPAVLGHSMGGITALALGSLFPDLPAAILSEDPPPWWLGPMQVSPDGTDLAARMRANFEAMTKLTVEELVSNQKSEFGWWPETEFQPWAEAKLRFNHRALALFSRTVVESLDWPALLPRLTCPLLLITADTDLGAIVPPVGGEALKKLVPQTQIAHVPGAGHSIHRDKPELFLAAIRPFLDSVAGT